MGIYDFVREASRDEFVNTWTRSEEQREKRDPNSDRRIDEHRKASFHYSLIELKETALSKIILPRHNAEHHFYKNAIDHTSIGTVCR